MNYKIVETFGHRALESLQETVRKHIQEGWVPLGGAIPTERNNLLHFTQTLIKTLKTAKKP
jgi:hypothetical protein